MSKSFAIMVWCASEQAAIVDKEIYDEFVEELKSYHTYFVTKRKSLLEESLALARSGTKT